MLDDDSSRPFTSGWTLRKRDRASQDFFSEFAYLRARARLELDYLSAFPKPASARPNIFLDILQTMTRSRYRNTKRRRGMM